MEQPKKLNKAPIAELICEIRFNSELLPDLVPATIMNALALSEIQKLPILEFPASVRNEDPNLRYLPHYRAKINDVIVQVGTYVIALSSPIPYLGWENHLKPCIKSVVDKVMETDVISQINRVSIRAINFSQTDMLENLKLRVENPLCYPGKGYHYADHYEDGDLSIRTIIANQATHHLPTGETHIGSVLDIEISIKQNITVSSESILDNIEKAHLEEKKVFFNLITKDYLESLDPIYD